MDLVPPPRSEVVKLAVFPLRAAVPRVMLPLLNVIIPVGAPPILFTTVAVNVTAWP
ncbi:MAG: hypothetical protein NVS1B11_32300 [Terriglobales bacterium]